jgi:hypothetical protein
MHRAGTKVQSAAMNEAEDEEKGRRTKTSVQGVRARKEGGAGLTHTRLCCIFFVQSYIHVQLVQYR